MEARSPTAQKTIQRFKGNQKIEIQDEMAVEFPLTFVLNGEEFATVICTPVHLEDMVYGLLAAEGIIRFARDIQSITFNESGGYVYVKTTREPLSGKNDWMKRIIGSCCGKSRHFYYENDAKTAQTVRSDVQLKAEDCFRFMDELHRQSTAFKKTGGIHNAAICSAEEGLIAVRTDIGRHNALDKLYGYCMRNNVRKRDKVIAFSGRISSEVLLKVSKMGIGILLSKSAPTDLALALADELNVTVAGFIRGNAMNVYSHCGRIVEA